MNDERNLVSEVLELCDGVTAVEAVSSLTVALAALILHAATPDKVAPLTDDVIRALRRNVEEFFERAGSPHHAQRHS